MILDQDSDDFIAYLMAWESLANHGAGVEQHFESCMEPERGSEGGES